MIYIRKVLDLDRRARSAKAVQEDLITDEHVLERGTIINLDHARAGKIRTFGSPLHLLRTPTTTGEAAPVLGEHGAQVLGELGFSHDEIVQLAEIDVVYLP